MDDPTKIRYTYDEEGDVMYISFGEPKPAISEEIVSENVDMLIRRDPQTKKLVGITILNYGQNVFKRRDREEKK